MAVKYLRLFDPTQQFQLKGGQLNVAGRLYVHLEATDDLAALYDENGTQLSQPVILDNNGRAAGLFVDSAQVYWLDVQDRYGMSQFTIRKMTPCGGGGGSLLGSTYNVVSSDGSIAVDKSEDAGVTTFDIGIAPNDSDEFLEWIKCSEEDCGSTWKPFYQDGTMETDEDGVKVHGGHLYHFTSTFYVDPNGTGINYDTFKVIMYCNDEIVDTRYFDIDSSLNDAVQCEFSTDVIPSEDGHVYYKLTIPSTCEVTGELQCHRIYSGINAVPDTCATKQWVQETFDYDMAEKISYSALEYNGNGEISGISGSAIAGGLDSTAVSSIASSYAESAISSISGWSADFSSISSKIDWSSSGVFQPSGDYQTAGDYAYNSAVSSKVDQSAFEQCCDEVHSSLDEKLDKSASSEFQPSGQYVYESSYSSFSSEVTNNISSISSTVSGLTGQYIEQSASSMFQPSGNYASASDLSAYVPFSGIEGEGGRVTGISGSAIKGHEYTGINPVTVNNTADTISVEHRTLCVDSTMTAYTTGDSAVIGVNVAGLDISSKMDASASSLFYSTSNPSGFVTGVDLTPYQLTADMSAYAHESSLSAKLDASASSDFYGTANPSGFIDGASASAIASAYQVVSATATQLNAGTAYLTSVNDTPISASRAGNAANASLANSAWYDGTGRLISSLPDEATVSSIASAYAESAASSKQDASAMSAYALSADVSGVIDTVSSNSASWAGGITGDYLTSKVGSGQATFTTAFQDGLEKRPTLMIEAQRNAGSSVYPRMMITDWNNTTGETHSGALLANAFEFYICPESAWGKVDPSGILQSRLDASHLQFNVNPAVSSFTKSSEYTRYGMRLGSAGNSASWVTISGNSSSGGFITLDDGSGTSGRAYASSIPYWNDKLDGSASSSFYSTANESGYVDSAYVESQVSSKQDTLTFDWDADSAISSINGSALAGQGGAQVVTSITTGGYGVREINGMVINASHMVLGAEAAYNTSNIVKLGNSDYGAGVFLTGNFGSAYYKVNELQLNRNGTGFIGFNIGGAGSQITATSNAGGKFSAGGTGGNRSYFTAFNASASASIEVTGGTAMVNITDTGYTSTIYPSSIPYWNGKMDSAEMSAYVAKSAYDNLYSAFTALNDLISQYSAYFSSISAKVDNSAIGVIE